MKKNEQMLQKKNIKIFLDTNVLLNYITNREDDELEASIRLLNLVPSANMRGIFPYNVYQPYGSFFENMTMR